MIDHDIYLKMINRYISGYRGMIRSQWLIISIGLGVILATLASLITYEAPSLWILVVNIIVFGFMVDLLVRSMFFIERCLLEIEKLEMDKKNFQISLIRGGNVYG